MKFTPCKRRWIAATALLASLVVPVAVSPAPVAAATEPTVEITGHGWGHGRGLGQWGAYGYAKDYGWSSAQILDHYYGNTVAGQATASSVDPHNVRIEIRSQRGVATAVGRLAGTFTMVDANGEPAINLTPEVPEGQTPEEVEPEPFGEMTGAVRFQISSDGFKVWAASSCGGPWTEIGSVDSAQIDVERGSGITPLHQCRDDGSIRRYAGVMRATRSGTSARTVNITTIEEYLRGVVPNESPAYWPYAALEAQAVAARSYALAGDTRQHPYADTCDTTLCQVYGGLDGVHSRTDTAIANTTGLVRLRNGKVARTEFSASTGGYTVAGDFPAVEDLGDATAGNPVRNWSETVNLGTIESSYGLGALRAIDVTERNGLGSEGGRVLSVALRFDGGTRTITGDRARRLFGLKSDWFSVGEVIRPEDEARGEVSDVLHEFFVGATPSDEARQEMIAMLSTNGDNYEALAFELAQSDAWAGVMIDDLYETALGRPSDEGGRDYWLRQLRKPSVKFAKVGVWFFGSEEYFQRSGNTNEGFVTQLYTDLLHREPDDGGMAYWVGRLEAGATPSTVASGFWASLESRRDRANVVASQVLGRSGSAQEIDVWAEWLLKVGDTGLTARMAASEEFLAPRISS